jgi:hypothetical protein
MIRNEERTGLVLTVAGGAGLLLLLLWMLGFFQKPELPAPAAVHATPRRSGSVAGEIVDAKSGRAVEGPAIEISGLDGVSDHWLAPADPALPARFELKGVPSERDFVLEVDAPGYVGVRRPTRVAAGATVDAGTIRLVPLATISGTVVDANYEALADAEIVAEPIDAGTDAAATKSATARSDARGAFRLDALLPAKWSVHATTPGGERSLAPVVVDASCGGAAAPIEMELFPPDASVGASPFPPDGTNAPGDMTGPRSLVIRVVDENGAPLAGARVFYSINDASHRARLTARNGKTTFRGIRDEVRQAWSVTAMSGSRRSFNDQPIPIALAGAETPFELRCLPTHSLAVKVLDSERAPVAGAVVGVRVPRMQTRMAFSSGSRDPSFDYKNTDADGLVRFDVLPPPPWTISIAGSGFEPWSTTDAKPDADDTVTVQLVKKKSDG